MSSCGRKAKTPSTTSTPSVGMSTRTPEWSIWVSGSMLHNATRPEPPGAAGSSSSRRAASLSKALR